MFQLLLLFGVFNIGICLPRQYHFITENKTWNEAQRYCRENYVDLVTINNAEEELALTKLVENWNSGQTWIGLYDDLTSWKWSLDDDYFYKGKERSFRNWYIQKPRNSNGNTMSSTSPRQYHFINENKTWTEAQIYCRENYTDLATIDNMEEMNTLLNTVNGSYSGLAWIGLYDDLESWRWSLDNDTFYLEGERDYRGWYHQPDNYNGKELCVYIGSDGTWFDGNCNTYLSIVCYDGKNETDEYRWINQRMTWTEAQSYCREHYTDLPSVRNQTDNHRIFNLTGGSAAWIGLYRTRLWSDKKESAYENWRPAIPNRPAEPNNGVNTMWQYNNQHCTAVSFRDSGQWTDEYCFATLPFICYNITASSSRQYYFVNENKTWTEAQKFCRKNYTDLATIDNMEEMDSLLMTANDSYSGLAWIGLYDDLDSWRWSLDNDTFYQEGERDYRGWSHQPDNYYGNELCASINYRGEWFDQPCTDKRTFVCYNGTHDTYVWIYNLMTWEEAQRFCRANHRDLASVRNETELQRIVNIMNSYDVWIGLYRNRLWSDQSSSTFTYWRPEIPAQTPEPDNGVYSSGQNGYQHCTAVDRSGHWTDEHCLYSFPFICYTAFTPAMSSTSPRQYHFINENKTWTEAQIYCRENYTDLATLDNIEEMNTLLNTINGSYSGLAWIGLYDDQESWRWSLDNDYQKGERDYRGWEHQPDNYNGKELCVSITSDGSWFDVNCNTYISFVCYDAFTPGAMFQLLLLMGFFNLGVCLPRQFHFINESKTWAAAQRYCRENYVDLATINNAEEELVVTNLIGTTDSKQTWIGLYDDLNSWKWSLDDDSFYNEGERSFRNWYIQKPRYWYENRLCVYLSDNDAVWVESSCSKTHPFICFDGRENANEMYVPVIQFMNWTEAQRYCREHYTDLASVRNETENQKIRSLLYFNDYYNYNFWIGLYKNRSWSDKSRSSFSNWKSEEPDNYALNESCAAVSFDDDGKWSDEKCSQGFPFLCYSKMSSLLSRQYHFINENKTWADAQRYCRENYIDLATIDNMEEMNTLLNTVNGRYSGLAWIGLYGELDSWRWSLDDDDFYHEGERDYRGWFHEPDNYNGNEMCVSMNSEGEWFDQICTDRKTFICYNGKNGTEMYTWINQHMTWTEAQHYCRKHYTDLASVRKQTDNQEILNLTGGSAAWIGLYRTRLWSNKQESTYENWRPATPEQPDNGLYAKWESGNQHCTAVSFRDSGHWTDENCLATFPFICYEKSCTGSSCTLHQYHFVNENKTWTDAQGYCRDKYTDLATIDNMEEMNSLINTVNGIYLGLAWIGLYNDLNSWKWSLDDDSFYKQGERSFRRWYINKPSWNWNDGRVNATEKYVPVYQYMTWTEAQRYCREHYTDLTSVRNEIENQKIRSLISVYFYNEGFWIGLYKNRSWSDKSNSSFCNWKPGEPDNYGQNISCTTVSFNDGYHYGKWTDENCGEVLPFLCYSTKSLTSPHEYHFINEKKTWTEAQRHCRQNYSDLASINDMKEMTVLLNTVNGSYSGLAWIGLYDDLNSWKWSLDDDSFYQEGEKDFRWWFHEPDNFKGKELCVSMNNRGEWFDRPCNDRKTFVCFNGMTNSYVGINDPVTWEKARSFCRVNYTDLASVRNETELQQILTVIKDVEVWIGLYRNQLWSDQSNSTFTYWRPASSEPTEEPDNGVNSHGQRGNQRCTAVEQSGQWTDENCFNSFPFICYTSEFMSFLNQAVRLVFNLPKFSHTTPLLRSLHWLPVAAHIRFKTLMIAYKAKNGPAHRDPPALLDRYHLLT
ncbi:C-type mannose receptor 2 isoform X2 [Silurus meridionalis]|nr:C-type mannose receptor 2 isoform X2 [Silurus meridionalis]